MKRVFKRQKTEAMNDPVTSRRPIKSRQQRWASAAARALKSHGVTPNQVSIASVVFAAFAGAAFLATPNVKLSIFSALFYVCAALCIQLRLICNLLDGMIAVEGGMKTATGDIYNDLPDRISDTIVFVCAGYAANEQLHADAAGWAAAVAAMLTAYIRMLGAASGTPHYFSGPMAKQHRMAIMTIASFAAVIEVITTGTNYAVAVALWLIIAGSLTTCARRLKLIADALNANAR